MRIFRGNYQGMACYFLENQQIRLAVIPELGAKIASLVYKPQDFEVFFQPIQGCYSLAHYGANFADYDTSGADEMFPTIDPCLYPYQGYEGKALPDHGELWSIPWQVREAENSLVTQVQGTALPYIFTRTIRLEENMVHLKYRVSNLGAKSLYGLWAFHGLVTCDEATRLILPETQQLVTVHDSKLLGPVGTRHGFPTTRDQAGNPYRLDLLNSKAVEKTEKIYVEGTVEKGEASLILNKGRLEYKLIFPKTRVPYLGIWINEGGFKGEYNCALEPSTGYYDSLEIAHKLNSIQPISPGEAREWFLDIQLKSC